MRKTQVRIKRHGHLAETIPGWQPAVPGLVVARYNPGVKKTDERWFLWHEASGTRIRTFDKRADAEQFALWLGGVSDVDWTLDADASTLGPAMAAYIQALEMQAEATLTLKEIACTPS
jgi:hypothetical protein